MIKKYLEFIKENNEFNSLGEWVESLYSDEYVKNIVNRFISDITPDIKLSNAINLLDDNEKADIKAQIDEYKKNGIEDKDVDVLASAETELLESADSVLSGKGIFTSFLKSLTALGKKDTTPNKDKCPDDFLLYYFYENMNSEDVKSVFSRFKSLTRHIEHIDYAKNELDIYYGIKTDGLFEYGISYDDKQLTLGRFKLSQSIIKWLVQLDLKSASSLKKELVNLTYNDILLLGKIKNDMKEFMPGYHEKRAKPTLNDGKVISFGYYGLSGQWNGSTISIEDLSKLKGNFINFISNKKWFNKVLISVNSNNNYVFFNLKIK